MSVPLISTLSPAQSRSTRSAGGRVPAHAILAQLTTSSRQAVYKPDSMSTDEYIVIVGDVAGKLSLRWAARRHHSVVCPAFPETSQWTDPGFLARPVQLLRSGRVEVSASALRVHAPTLRARKEKLTLPSRRPVRPL